MLLLCVSAVSPVSAQRDAVSGVHSAEVRAHQYVESQDWDKAYINFAEAAEAGSPTAMAWLGMLYEEGRGVVASDVLAVQWYTRALEAGADHLALKLGWLYLTGTEAVRDRALSEYWFEYGIERGNNDAMVALSSVLIADAQGGKGVERVEQASEWLLTAHESGHPVAKFFLARLYLEGIGEHPVDYALAWHYARLGAEEGHPQMQGWLAYIYKEGLGRQADPILAAKWAMLATAGGDPLGSQLLAELQQGLDDDALLAARERAMAWAD